MLNTIIIFALIFNLVNSYDYHGEVTIYTYQDSLVGGSCGLKDTSFNNVNGYSFAMNSEQYDNSLSCGRCIEIQYGNNDPVVLLSSNLCPECKTGDIDLFGTAWDDAIKESPGRFDIQWSFVNCDKFVSGNVNIRIDEINYYWLSVQPENFLCGVSSMEIYVDGEWKKMERDDNLMMGLYFSYKQQIVPPFKLKIKSIQGDELETSEMQELTNNVDMGGQFTCSGGGTSVVSSENVVSELETIEEELVNVENEISGAENTNTENNRENIATVEKKNIRSVEEYNHC